MKRNTRAAPLLRPLRFYHCYLHQLCVFFLQYKSTDKPEPFLPEVSETGFDSSLLFFYLVG